MSNDPEPNIVTLWRPVGREMRSQWGKVPYEKWCYLESDRINDRGGNMKVVYREGGDECAIEEVHSV